MLARIAIIIVFLVWQLPQLPPPMDTPWYRRAPRVVERPDGRELTMPVGFTINVFADGLTNPRWMARAPNGDVFLAESRSGEIIVLRDADGDGVAEFRDTFSTDMDRPFGLAFREGHLYVGENGAVVRFAYRDGQTKATGEPETVVELPPSNHAVDRDTAARLGIELRQTRGYNHWTRNLIFHPDGTKLYVTIGSATNSTPGGDERRAAINEYAVDGSSHRIFASGLRNPVGLAFYPGTDELWTSVNERDQLGDDVPPDYITSVRDGGFYGWPYSYIGRHVDPTVTPQRPDLVAEAITPEVLLPAHSAPLGMIFYQGQQFPEEYRNSALIALHGSINRSRFTGYSVVRVPFENGVPSGPPEDFLSGFLVRDDDDNKQVWGRPVGLLEMADGSVLVTDDGGRLVWRISYDDDAASVVVPGAGNGMISSYRLLGS